MGEHRGRQALFCKQSPEVLESLKEVAIIESSESSNRLEGITAPHHRIAALIKGTQPKNRSEQEIAGYRDALSLIHESGVHMQFSTNVILQLHAMLYRFRATPAVTTPFAMEELARNYTHAIQVIQQEPLVVVPAAILDFLCIHPFSDGNGRTARLLTLLLLYHFDYQVGKYISLERIFEDSKESYYETLEYSSQGWHDDRQDIMPWLNYFWGVLLRAYKEFEERVGAIRRGRGAKTDQIRASVGRKVESFSISDIERDCPGVSRDMIRTILRQLRDEGGILSQGMGRAAKWIKK